MPCIHKKALDWHTDKPHFLKKILVNKLRKKVSKFLPSLQPESQAVIAQYVQITIANEQDFEVIRLQSALLSQMLVKEIALKGYYGSCSTLDQELDTELYLHVVKSNEQSALTVHRGKCRRIDAHQLPEPYTILPFSEHIPLGESVVAR